MLASNPFYHTVHRVQTNLKMHGLQRNPAPSNHMSKTKFYCLLDNCRAAGFEQNSQVRYILCMSISFHLKNLVNSDKYAKLLKAF